MPTERRSTPSDDLSLFTKELGYAWLEPLPPGSPGDDPLWLRPAFDARASFVDHIVRLGWKATDLRRAIEDLGSVPKGRTRAELAKQLVETLLEPEHLREGWETLSEEEQVFFAYFLLSGFLQEMDTEPTTLPTVYPFSRPIEDLGARILGAGLAIGTEEMGYFVPRPAYAALPVRVPFPDELAPREYADAQDPMVVLLLLQQMVTLFRTGAYHLRPMLAWKMRGQPDSAYRWPVTLEVAKAVQAPPFDSAWHTLLPLAPLLDDRALEDAEQQLKVPRDTVELLCQLAISLRLVEVGSPVTVDRKNLEAWLGLSPPMQAMAVFQAYRSLSNWADWYPSWRKGELTLKSSAYAVHYPFQINVDMGSFCSELRTILLGMLALLPWETWLSVEKVGAWIGRIFPTQNTQLYQRLVRVAGEESGWKAFLQKTLEAMLVGALNFLGLVDVSLGAASQPVLFRTRYLHKLQWGQVPEWPLPEVRVLASDELSLDAAKGELAVRMPVPAKFLSGVQRWARLSGFSKNVLIYHLDALQLHGAFRAGATPEYLAALWREDAGCEPLAELVEWWETWWDRYGHVRIYADQAMLMTRDESTLREIQVALPELRAAVLGVITPRAALIEPGRAEQVCRGLQRQGYMPKEIL